MRITLWVKGSIPPGERTGPSTGDLGSSPTVPLPLPDLSCVLGLCIRSCAGVQLQKDSSKRSPPLPRVSSVETLCVRVHITCTCMCIQRPEVNEHFFQLLSMLFLKPSLLPNPDITGSTRLASQSALAILQSWLFPALRLQACTILCSFLYRSSSMRQACYQLNHLSKPLCGSCDPRSTQRPCGDIDRVIQSAVFGDSESL